MEDILRSVSTVRATSEQTRGSLIHTFQHSKCSAYGRMLNGFFQDEKIIQITFVFCWSKWLFIIFASPFDLVFRLTLIIFYWSKTTFTSLGLESSNSKTKSISDYRKYKIKTGAGIG